MDIGHAFESALDFVFPIHCAGCGKTQSGWPARNASPATARNDILPGWRSDAGRREVCEECFAAIPMHKTLSCGRCKARLPEGKKICHASFPYVLGAATDYNHATVRELVHRLKFHGAKNAARPLGDLLAAYVKKLPVDFSEASLIAIPLGIRRMRERGFNQAELVARHVAEKLRLPLETDALIRIRDTAPQSETENRAARLQNVRGCFLLARPEAVRGSRMLLIDDVTTSGATFFEAASVLKNGGARSVLALAVAEA